MQGRLFSVRNNNYPRRITPAYAGKYFSFQHLIYLDHPRIRREDSYLYAAGKGLPPHTRGRLPHPTLLTGGIGITPRMRGIFASIRHLGNVKRITPACAGNTALPAAPKAELRDYPRLRGEDDRLFKRPTGLHGLPPPARGRH